MHDGRRRTQCKGSGRPAQARRDWRGRCRPLAGQQAAPTLSGPASGAAGASGHASLSATCLCYCRPCPCLCPCRRPCPEPGRRQTIDGPTRRRQRRRPTETPTIDSRPPGIPHASWTHPPPSLWSHSPTTRWTAATDAMGAHHCRQSTRRQTSQSNGDPTPPPSQLHRQQLHRQRATRLATAVTAGHPAAGPPAAAEAWHPMRPRRAAAAAAGMSAGAAAVCRDWRLPTSPTSQASSP